MSDEEPHDGQESATMHWILALASVASWCDIERSAMESERGRGIRRRVENDLRQSEHRYRCFG